MAYITKIQALDAICRPWRRRRPSADDPRPQRVVPAARRRRPPVRNVRALNEFFPILGAEDGHFLEMPALNAIAARLGGSGGHRLSLPALAEIAASAGGGWAPGPVRLFGAGDSRFADGRQGTPPYDSGYVLHRYSALNLAVWGLRGKVADDAGTDLFATAGCSWSNGSTPTSPTSSPPSPGQQPVVLVHLGTHGLPWVPLDAMQAQATPVAAALTGAGARVLWLLENPRSGGNGLAPRTRRSASPRTPGSRRRTEPAAAVSAPSISRAFTADGLATGGAARAGLQRDDLHDTQAGAFVRLPPPSPSSRPFRRSRTARYAGAAGA